MKRAAKNRKTFDRPEIHQKLKSIALRGISGKQNFKLINTNNFQR